MSWEQWKAADLIILVIVVWLALLSFYTIKAIGRWRKLTRGANNIDLAKVLEDILEKQDFETRKINEVSTSLVKFQAQSQGNIQKYSLIRFNPFEDAGGDQSFVISLLDGKDNGVVISSLHSRNGTRVYAKGVVGAKPATHQFTKEEKEAVEKATHKK